MYQNIRTFILKYSHRFVSPWVVLVIDLSIVMMAFMVAYLLRFNFTIGPEGTELMFKQMLVYALYCLVFFLAFRTHKGIVRHTGLNDLFRTFLAITFSIITLWGSSKVLYLLSGQTLLNYSEAILLITYMASLVMLMFFRFAVKVVYLSFTRERHRKDNVMIFGAGEMGIATLNTINATSHAPYYVVGFLDDNPGKHDKSIGGIKVFAPEKLNKEFLARRRVQYIILAVQSMKDGRRREIIEQCLELDCRLLTVPSYRDWRDGQLTFKQIRKVDIGELLQRAPIKIENKLVGSRIKSRRVMITGAAGSIGSELARQIIRLKPQTLVLLDQAETPLFHLEQELKPYHADVDVHYILGDVSRSKSMRQVFKRHKPEIIYHAAAYKHVPVIESNPLEALRVNVFGTRNIAMLAFEHHATDFVLVSTDKAVNPTSFMGASKRLAEIYIQSLGNYTHSSTRFITTRFGNVLGSNGSVIPIFEKQIAAGGPVTVTHPDMTRFFMTIPEACELVLEASVMGHGGEILVFDMGEQMRILDVAHKMIKLSGLEPGKDIEITFSGLRPGEKLYEELFSDSEENLPTHHPKIMIARLNGQNYERVTQKFEQIELMIGKRDFKHILAVFRELVPEYQTDDEHEEMAMETNSL